MRQGVAWSAHDWLAFALAVLSLVMLRAYPKRECVHVSLLFLTWGIVASVSPSLTSASSLALAGVLAALGYLVIERVVRPHEPAICARLGVIDARVMRRLSVDGRRRFLVWRRAWRSWSWSARRAERSSIWGRSCSRSLIRIGGSCWPRFSLFGVYLTVLASDPEG